MNKSKKRYISIVVVIVMLFSCMNVNALAKVNANNTASNIYSFTDNSGTHVTIEEVDRASGIKVLRQYNNGKLVEEVEIKKGDTELKIKDENGKITTKDARSIIKKAGTDARSYSTNYTKLGRINYEKDPTTFEIHSIRLKYTTTVEQDSYTVDAYKGYIVDLVAAIISVIAVPASIMTQTIKAICVAYGISIVSGKIKDFLTTTVSAKIDNYSFMCTDTINTNHYREVTGRKAFIDDDTVKYKGKTYYEGYIPKDWKTETFGKTLYIDMFGVVGVSPVSYGSY